MQEGCGKNLNLLGVCGKLLGYNEEGKAGVSIDYLKNTGNSFGCDRWYHWDIDGVACYR